MKPANQRAALSHACCSQRPAAVIHSYREVAVIAQIDHSAHHAFLIDPEEISMKDFFSPTSFIFVHENWLEN